MTPVEGGVGCWSNAGTNPFVSCRPVQALGIEIRRLRHAAGYSQEVLAEMVGSDRAQIAYLELGDHSVSIETLRLVALALGTRLSDVMAGVGL